MLWIPVTIFAALMQNFRFMFQKHLRVGTLSTGGATYSRFVFAMPLVALVAAGYLWVSGTAFPIIEPRFWPFAALGGLFQILGTMCVVALFQHRNFAVGITFAKTEVLLTALVGFLILGDSVSQSAVLAMAIGFLAVVLLSQMPTTEGATSVRVFNRATALGLSSGVFFGLCSVLYRGATFNVMSDDFFVRSSITLALVIALQLIMMTAYLGLKEPGQIKAVFRAWRVAKWVGILSLFGSLGWFTAFALQNAAYVKALGQIELLFSFLATLLFYKEKTTLREILGMILLVISMIVLITLG